MDAEEIDYQLTKAYWDDRTNSLVKQNRTLRNGLFATFGLLGLSVWGVIHLGGSVKTEVIPVFVDNTGATTAGDSGGQTLAPGQWNQMKYSAFSNYVTQWRTVTSDDKLRKRFWDSSFEWIQARSKAETDLKNWFKQHNPDTRSLEETVSVVVDSGSPITENTYEVWWTESTYKSGEETVKKEQVIFTYRIVGEPTSKHNGFGILITDYTLPKEINK